MCRLSAILFAVAASGTVAAAVAQKYQITAVPTLCDSVDPSRCGSVGYAYGINNSGVVVGHSRGPMVVDSGDVDGDGNTTEERLSFSSHAFLWQSGAAVDLGHLGKNESYAVAVNNNGDVVGRSPKVTAVSGTTETIQYRAFRVLNGGSITDLGVPSQVTSLMAATDIDDQGYVVGYANAQVISGSTTAYTRGFVWSPVSSSVLLIPGLEEKSESVLRAVNSQADLAVGYSVKEGVRKAIKVSLSNPTTLTEVGTLGGTLSEANDVDSHGRIIGRSHIANNAKIEAFLYDPAQGETLRGLGQLSDRSGFSEALAMNENGLIVGVALLVGDRTAYQAVAYDAALADASLVNLNSRIDCAADSSERWSLTSAVAVNDNGQIVGYGSQGGIFKAFVLTPDESGVAPVACPPTPAFENQSGGGSSSMGAIALLMLACIRRRRSRI